MPGIKVGEGKLAGEPATITCKRRVVSKEIPEEDMLSTPYRFDNYIMN